jgi:hypothetical protein
MINVTGRCSAQKGSLLRRKKRYKREQWVEEERIGGKWMEEERTAK